jgi:hypothetical protein
MALIADRIEYPETTPAYYQSCPENWWKRDEGFRCPEQSFPITKETQSQLEMIFNGLVKKWKAETGGSSLTTRRYAHPSYQSILVLGGKEPEVVKLILKELQRSPDMWFEALRHLTNENPAKDAKSFELSTKAWLKWDREKHK